jgi:hypothetical protein
MSKEHKPLHDGELFRIENSHRIVLSAEAIAMAASNGQTPEEMARHLLQQHHDRAAWLIQKTGEN